MVKIDDDLFKDWMKQLSIKIDELKYIGNVHMDRLHDRMDKFEELLKKPDPNRPYDSDGVPLYSRKECMLLLDISSSTFLRYRDESGLKFRTVRRRVYVREDHIWEFLNSGVLSTNEAQEKMLDFQAWKAKLGARRSK